MPPSLTPFKSRVPELIWYWGPVGLYAGLIFFLSAQSHPGRYVPSFLFGIWDKVLHAVEYGILAVLLYRAIKNTVSTRWAMALAIISAMAYGITDEIHQWFVPHRQADARDLLANTIGATFLVVLWVMITEKRHLFPSKKTGKTRTSIEPKRLKRQGKVS
jgi:VanZ family protein